jgi:hypothetical protein
MYGSWTYKIPSRLAFWFVEGTCNNMNIYFLKCAIHRAICMIQHLQSIGILTLIHASIWCMWNNFQSFICEKERIWDNGTKTVPYPMQHSHTKICSMKQLFELSSLMIKISLEFWTQKYMPEHGQKIWRMECCILYIQKGCSSYLIIILYIVFLFFIIQM